jgi:isopropylmalate/homocitrate/citramalate synthase
VRALSHGVRYASVTVNGIGARAGNASLHQVVMMLKELYGVIIPGFRYDMLNGLSRAFERYTGIPVQAHEPIVGDGVFSQESGFRPGIDRRISEKTVGGFARIVFGKHTETDAIAAIFEQNRKLLEDAGIVINETLVNELTAQVKHIREAMIKTGHTQRIIERHYDDYCRLGISEVKFIELVLSRMNCTRKLNPLDRRSWFKALKTSV